MSQTEETQTPSDQPEATNDAVADFSDELHIVDAMKPTAAPTSNNKPLRYGTRKKKAGETGPNIKDLSSVSSFEEEEIEMDDLPIRANAPEELIDKRPAPSEPREEYGERRPRRNDRPRGERRERTPRERAPRRERNADEPSANPETRAEVAAAKEEGDRPERFGTVKTASTESSDSKPLEFRPSRDGRTNSKRERKPRNASDTPRSKPAPAKKKGLLAKIIAFFTGGDTTEEKKPQERNNRQGDRQRGPNNRQKRDGKNEGGEGGENRRRRRPRNRKPRQDGENGERRQGGPRGERQNREGGENRRPRRPRRPRQEGGKRDDGTITREAGRRAREESEASK